MATIIRHGGEAHTVRPDRVYRTSVLSPIFGYQPDADVQQVAAAFTLGPPSATMLNGLGANPFQKLGQRIRGAFARFRARNAQAATPAPIAAAMAAGVPPGHVFNSPNMPAMVEAKVIAPQLAHQAKMLTELGPAMGGGPKGAAIAMAKRRFYTYYRAG